MIGHPHNGPASAYPAKSTWKDFETIFNLNKPEMKKTGDTDQDIGFIWNAVLKAAKLGVEERVIFCIIMQESSGNVGVGVPSDNNTPGLMQCEGSPGFPGRHGLTQDEITSMVMAGTKHFKGNLLSNNNADTAEAIYEALRLYNSGFVDKHNLNDAGRGTASYVSDIANRLQGFHF